MATGRWSTRSSPASSGRLTIGFCARHQAAVDPQLCREHDVSRFTVVEAYDRLVALGYLQSRRGAGFYTATARCACRGSRMPCRRRAQAQRGTGLADPPPAGRRTRTASLAGGPWLPNDWLDEAGIRQSLNVLARKNGAYLLEYGNPFGYLPLREHLAVMLGEIGITARGVADRADARHQPGAGADHPLAAAPRRQRRWWTIPATTIMFGNLRLHGVRMWPVPRQCRRTGCGRAGAAGRGAPAEGLFHPVGAAEPDRHDIAPHVAFACCRPPSATISHRRGRHLLRPAERCRRRGWPRSISCNGVIYVRSFSKTLSGSLRVGFVACAQDIANELVETKMLTSITSSQFAERLIYLMLVDGHYRKYMARLQERLGEARRQRRARVRTDRASSCSSSQRGHVPVGAVAACRGLAASGRTGAARRDSCWRPATVFRPHLEPSPWMRFNVSTCEDTRVLQWLQRQAMSKPA